MVNAKEQKAIDYANIKGFNEITVLLLQYNPATQATFNKPAETPVTDEKPKLDLSAKKQALLDLKELLDAGILSQEEFDVEKGKILSS